MLPVYLMLAVVGVTPVTSISTDVNHSAGLSDATYLIVAQAQAEKKDEKDTKDSKDKKDNDKKPSKKDNCDSKSSKGGECESAGNSDETSDGAANPPEEDIEEGDVDEGNENTED